MVPTKIEIEEEEEQEEKSSSWWHMPLVSALRRQRQREPDLQSKVPGQPRLYRETPS